MKIELLPHEDRATRRYAALFQTDASVRPS